MDLLPKTVVKIRIETRSAVYRAALNNSSGCCVGFLLGSVETFVSPAMEFSLVSSAPKTEDELWLAPQLLRARSSLSEQVATSSGTKAVGLFTAWKAYPSEHRNQLLGLFVDTAIAMRLSYVIHFPTSGHETIWAPACYFANRFPHAALKCSSIRGRLSTKPRHNPRRVRALWRSLLREAPNA